MLQEATSSDEVDPRISTYLQAKPNGEYDFLETFEADWSADGRWVASTNEKYTGLRFTFFHGSFSQQCKRLDPMF